MDGGDEFYHQAETVVSLEDIPIDQMHLWSSSGAANNSLTMLGSIWDLPPPPQPVASYSRPIDHQCPLICPTILDQMVPKGSYFFTEMGRITLQNGFDSRVPLQEQQNYSSDERLPNCDHLIKVVIINFLRILL